MTQVELLRSLVPESQEVSNETVQFYLDIAKDIICERRFTTDVELEYKNIQVLMAIELFNKIGVEGQTSHSENGISRTYDTSDISRSLLSKVPVSIKTPFSTRKVVI